MSFINTEHMKWCIPNTTLINKLKDMKENDSNAAVKRTAAKTLDIIGIQ